MTRIAVPLSQSAALGRTLARSLLLLVVLVAVPADNGARALAADETAHTEVDDHRYSSAQASPSQWQNVDVQMIGELAGPFTSALAVAGDDVFMGGGQSVAVVDATDPAAPWLAGLSSKLSYYPVRAAAIGSHVFVTTLEGGFRIFDVRERHEPREVAHVDTPSAVREFVLADGHAYVAVEGGGLLTIDVTDPTVPHVVGSIDTPDTATGLAADGDLVFVAAGSSGLRLIDVNDPHAPHEIAAVDTPGLAVDVTASGGVAYVTHLQTLDLGGLLVIDAIDPATPRAIGSSDILTNGLASLEVAVEGKYAFVEAGASGLRVIDISDPRRPLDVGGYYPARSLSQLVAHRGYILANGACGPLLILAVQPSVGSSVHLPVGLRGWIPDDLDQPAASYADSSG